MTIRKNGFTLIELLVVIAIISLLSSVVFSALTSARAKARDASRISTARALKTALALYEDKNGSVANLGSGVMTATSSGSTTVDALVSAGYLSRKIASDAVYGTSTFYLGICSDGRYDVYTKVERPENAQAQSTLSAACSNSGALSSGFNYAYGFPPAGGGGGGVLASGCTGLACNAVPMPAPVAPLVSLPNAYVATGNDHTCMLNTSGIAYCWGNNSTGQLGNGTSGDIRKAPSNTAGSIPFQAITLGHQFTCALDGNGSAYCWGLNDSSQLGDGTTVSRNVPTPVSGGITFASIAAGYDHVCGLDAAGKAYCWGNNTNGPVGDATTVVRSVPTAVNTALAFNAITAGNQYTCGLDTTGKAYCWGLNDASQLGDGTNLSGPSKMVPVAVSTAKTFLSISAGVNHACGIASTHVPYCWGDDSQNEITSSGGVKSVPTITGASQKFNTITAGAQHTCGSDLSGVANCWGANDYGRNGTGSGAAIDNPIVPVWGSPVYLNISPGFGGHSCAADGSQNVYCWGSDFYGEIGDNTQDNLGGTHNIPTLVSMPF